MNVNCPRTGRNRPVDTLKIRYPKHLPSSTNIYMGHARQHSSTFCNTSVAAISAAFPSRKSKNEFFVSNTSLAHDWRIDIPPIYHLKHQKKNYLSSGISNFWDHPQSSSRFKLFQSPPQNSEKNQAAFLNSLGIQDTD